MSPMQRCFSDLICHPLVTSYVIDAYLCLAMLHAWTLEYQHIMDALHLRRQKANGQLEKTAGSPSQQGSGGCQHYTAIYAVET